MRNACDYAELSPYVPDICAWLAPTDKKRNGSNPKGTRKKGGRTYVSGLESGHMSSRPATTAICAAMYLG